MSILATVVVSLVLIVLSLFAFGLRITIHCECPKCGLVIPEVPLLEAIGKCCPRCSKESGLK